MSGIYAEKEVAEFIKTESRRFTTGRENFKSPPSTSSRWLMPPPVPS
jgi:hypothetical protein